MIQRQRRRPSAKDLAPPTYSPSAAIHGGSRWKPLRATAALATVTAILSSSFLYGGIAVASPSEFAVDDSSLTVNGRKDPVGIPGDAPSFSWALKSGARDESQSAYEIVVGTQPGASDIWNSGKVMSDDQTDILFQGATLEAGQRYFWSVRAWDRDGDISDYSGPAIFETGMLGAADWAGSQWIANATPPESSKWRDYTVTSQFSLSKGAFGLFVRAADVSNAYMWQITTIGGPKLRPHIKQNGQYRLLGEVDLTRFGITQLSLNSGIHSVEARVSGTTIITRIDGVEVDQRTDATFPYGFVGLRTHEVDGTVGWADDIRVTDSAGNEVFRTDFSGINPLTGGTVQNGRLVLGGSMESIVASKDKHLPLMRKDFGVQKELASARVYASAHGVYELSINGKTVGDQKLAPGWTDYNKRIQTQTYDVTGLLKSGENTIGAVLSDGWWAGSVGLGWTGLYGKQADKAFIAMLRLDYTDGTTEWVKTDQSWTSGRGPFAAGDLQAGESYDARFEQAGWDSPGFSSPDWSPVRAINAPLNVLVPQPDEPVRVTEVRDVRERTEPKPGAFIYDVGQNMVGVAKVTLTGKAGERIRIRHGEELNQDGTLYTANLRGAAATDYYTFAEDGTVTYEPRFTQHGFRYIEITGAGTPPDASQVKGMVWGSDLPSIGSLDTSSSMLNQLNSNISWGQRGNFLSIPTDTPARDERLGWTGDIGLFAPTASYIADTRGFLSKWMADVRDAQYSDGNLPSVVPWPPNRAFGETGIAWSDATITVPHAVWNSSGDTKIVRDNWEAITKFFTFVRSSAGTDLLETGRATWFSQDWLHLNDPTPIPVLGTAYYAEDARMMSEMAAAIGRTAEAEQWAALSQDIRKAFTAAYVAADGTVQGDAQTGYALALGMNLVTTPELKAKVGEKFIAKLARTDFHLTTGFVGTPQLLPALSAIDRPDLAYKMLTKETYPSWGYEVAMGATTMWERWNSILPNGQFGDVSMNSFNHYAYGAVGTWMHQNIGGLQQIKAGYKESRIAPVVGGGLTHGTGSVKTPFGKLSSGWSVDAEGRMTLAATIPVNTTAEVIIPVKEGQIVLEGNTPASSAAGVHSSAAVDGHVRLKVGSGDYRFRVVAKSPATVTANITSDTIVYGTAAGISVSVGGPYGPASGDVVLVQGSEELLRSTLQDGKAAFSIPNNLTPGEYKYAVTFTGDSTYTAATASLGFAVTKAPSTVVLTLDRNHVTMDDTVVVNLKSTGILEGTATLFDDKTALATVQVKNGTGTASVSHLSAGSHALKVTLNETATHVASAAAQVSVDVLKKGKSARTIVITSSNSVKAGEAVKAAAYGFATGEPVKLQLTPSQTVLGTAVAESDGHVSLSVTVPAGLQPGSYRLHTVGSAGSDGYFPMTVTAAG